MFQRAIALFFVFFIATSIQQAQAQSKAIPDSIAFDRDIRSLLEVTKAADLAMQSMNATIDRQLEQSPEMKEFWEAFRAEIKKAEFVNLLAPIYKKHYSHADVKELIVFYKSPLGQRMIQSLPAITIESQEAGMKWGEEIARRAMEKTQQQ